MPKRIMHTRMEGTRRQGLPRSRWLDLVKKRSASRVYKTGEIQQSWDE